MKKRCKEVSKSVSVDLRVYTVGASVGHVRFSKSPSKTVVSETSVGNKTTVRHKLDSRF